MRRMMTTLKGLHVSPKPGWEGVTDERYLLAIGPRAISLGMSFHETGGVPLLVLVGHVGSVT